jgi:hypothetical protein
MLTCSLMFRFGSHTVSEDGIQSFVAGLLVQRTKLADE